MNTLKRKRYKKDKIQALKLVDDDVAEASVVAVAGRENYASSLMVHEKQVVLVSFEYVGTCLPLK